MLDKLKTYNCLHLWIIESVQQIAFWRYQNEEQGGILCPTPWPSNNHRHGDHLILRQWRLSEILKVKSGQCSPLWVRVRGRGSGRGEWCFFPSPITSAWGGLRCSKKRSGWINFLLPPEQEGSRWEIVILWSVPGVVQLGPASYTGQTVKLQSNP